MKPAGLPVLTYHALDHGGSVLATDPSWFAETLAVLVESGHRAVDLGDWIARGRPEVERGFALTFDDGLYSILDVADVLARYRVPSTVFLVTDRMGADNAWPGQPSGVPRLRLLGWSDLETLGSAGCRFGAHSRSHARLDRCDPPRLEDELRGSRDAVQQRTGRSCPLLAYPHGVAPPRVRRAAARHFEAAFGTRLDLASSSQGPFDLARIDAYYLRGRRGLERLISGDWEPWLRVRRTLRKVRRFRFLRGCEVPAERIVRLFRSAGASRSRKNVLADL